MNKQMKKVSFPIPALVLVMIATILSMGAANADSPSWVWGVDPASTDNELVLLDAWTGTEYARFALPTISSGDMEQGLAGESAQLYYVNGDVNDSKVYLLDPTDGSTLGTVILLDGDGWDVDGLGNYNGSAGYLYSSGCPVEDLHRYPAVGGLPTYYWSTIYDPKTVGGDDTGRIYTYGQLDDEYGDWVIAQIDPENNVAPLNTFTSPSEDPVGMAYDGTDLYVSDTSDMLYILDRDDGTVLNSLDLGFTLYALAVTEELPPPALVVEKDYRYTNVCFEKDNDGDGDFNEDPIDGVDNDLDGRLDEDPVDCEETSLGTLLPIDTDGDYIVEAVVKKNNKVKSYNPGQYYAVSTVNVLMDTDELTIEEKWCECTGISALSPEKGGGSVVIVQVGPDDPDEVAYQILDAKSEEVTVVDCKATAVLEDVSAGTTILMYVKFGPAMKGETWTGPYDPCLNINAAMASIGGGLFFGSDSATLELIEKE